MEKYISQTLKAFPDDIKTLMASPASDPLFKINHMYASNFRRKGQILPLLHVTSAISCHMGKTLY